MEGEEISGRRGCLISNAPLPHIHFLRTAPLKLSDQNEPILSPQQPWKLTITIGVLPAECGRFNPFFEHGFRITRLDLRVAMLKGSSISFMNYTVAHCARWIFVSSGRTPQVHQLCEDESRSSLCFRMIRIMAASRPRHHCYAVCHAWNVCVRSLANSLPSIDTTYKIMPNSDVVFA